MTGTFFFIAVSNEFTGIEGRKSKKGKNARRGRKARKSRDSTIDRHVLSTY